MNTETVNPSTFHRTCFTILREVCCPPHCAERNSTARSTLPCRVPTVGNPTVLKTTGMRQNLNTWGGTSLSAVLGYQKPKNHHFTTWRLKTTGSWTISPHLGMKQHIFQCLVASNMLNGTYTSLSVRYVPDMWECMVPKKLNKLVVCFLPTNLSGTHIYKSFGQCIPLAYWVMFLPPFRGMISMIPNTLYQNQKTNPLGVGQLYIPPKILRNQGKG